MVVVKMGGKMPLLPAFKEVCVQTPTIECDSRAAQAHRVQQETTISPLDFGGGIGHFFLDPREARQAQSYRDGSRRRAHASSYAATWPLVCCT